MRGVEGQRKRFSLCMMNNRATVRVCRVRTYSQSGLELKLFTTSLPQRLERRGRRADGPRHEQPVRLGMCTGAKQIAWTSFLTPSTA